MELHNFGDIIEHIQNGASNKQNDEGIGYPCVRIETLQNSQIDINRIKHIDLNDKDFQKYRLENGDLLFNHINSIEHVGKVALFEGQIENLVLGINVLRIKLAETKANPRYIFFLLQSKFIKNQIFNRAKRAVNQVSLNQSDIKSLKIPLPPLKTQRKIVEILERADALRRKRQEADGKTSRILQAAFVKMFGDPVKNEMGWESKKLCDLSLLITKGESPKWQGYSYVDDGVPFIRSENIRWGNFSKTNMAYIPVEFHNKLSRSKLNPNDVLINLVGASIGRAAILPSSLKEANINQAVAVIRVNKRKLNPYYLLNLIINPIFQMRNIQSQSVEAARANISLTDLKNLKIPLPPLKLQQKFARLVENVESMKERQAESTAQIDEMFRGLMQKAFRGELVA